MSFSVSAHLNRIGPPVLRVPLLTLWFLPSMVAYVVTAVFIHPDPLFFLRARFWMLPVDAYVAAIQGAFAP